MPSAPVSAAILCSSLEARRCFPILFKRSLPLFSSLSVTHHPAHASRRRITGELWLFSTPHPPIYLLPFSILLYRGMATHLFSPNPTLMHVLYFLSSSSLSVSHYPHPPLQPPCSLSLSGEMSTVLYFAVTLKAAFIIFMLRWCGNRMASLH